MEPHRAKTNFEKVQEFNRAFDMVSQEPETYSGYYEDEQGHIQIDPFKNIRPALFTDSPKIIKLRLDLIKEELSELNQAIIDKDFIETRDALADILYVVYGMADVLGIDIDTFFKNEITNSINPNTHEKFIEVVAKYSNQGADLERPIGLSNFNWVQVYLAVYPALFLELDNWAQLTKQNILTNIQTKINTAYNQLEQICNSEITKNITAFHEIALYITQLLKWVYCYSEMATINSDSDFAIVHDSNMSKLCDTEADAQATVADYLTKFAEGTSPYDTPYYYELPKLGKWIVKNKSTGKALKNIKYRKVVF
jgi:predicted HAD superfamily Cof-like phosphohydrolase